MKPGNKFLKSLFEVTHVEFQTYDLANQHLLFSSGMAHQLLGYSAEEYHSLSGDFYRAIVHPDDYQQIRNTINGLCHAQTNQVFEMIIRLRRRDGEYIWVYSRQMIYERKPDKNICAIIREVEDVTRLMELQEQLKAKVDQLRVVSFKNSHLLRSPVASIIGLVDLIDEQGITSEHNRQVFNYLKETIIKLDEVVHEINDIARID